MNDEMPTTGSATQRKHIYASMLEMLVAYLNDKSTCHFLGMGEENVTKLILNATSKRLAKKKKLNDLKLK